MSGARQDDDGRPPRRAGVAVYPGWGEAPPFVLAPTALSRPRTVQVMGIYSLLLLPAFGVGVPLAVATLVLAGRVRRELALAGGRGPGGREVRVGAACARVALALAAVLAVLWTVLAVLA